MAAEQPRKLDPATRDELAHQLREALKQKRPRRQRLVLAASALALIGGLALWWFYPRGEPPRLHVVAYDAVGQVGQEIRLHGALAAIESPTSLHKRELVFVLPSKQVTLRTGPAGGASTSWTWNDPDKQAAEFIARLVGDKRRPGMDDHGSVFIFPPAASLCLVQIDDTLSAAKDDVWRKENLIDIPPVAGLADPLMLLKKQGLRLVYLAANTDSPLAYQKRRGWVRHQAARGILPSGPVLGLAPDATNEDAARPWQTLAERLTQAVPAEGTKVRLAIAGTPDAAQQFHSAGFHTYYVGPAQSVPPQVVRVGDWQELKRALETASDKGK